jgi:hypothetical protein
MEKARLFTIGVTLLALGACSTENTSEIGTFYRQNPGVAGVGSTKAVAAYLLCAPGTVPATAQSYVSNGYRLLGESDFQNLTAEPMRAQALAYAQQIGATLVLYSLQPLGQEIHPVTKTVLESEGHNVTTTTVQQTSTPSPYSVNTDVTSPDFLKPADNSGSSDNTTKTTTTTTYVPPKYRTQVVPEIRTRTQHSIAFLAK